MSRLQSIMSAIVTYVVGIVAPSAEIWVTQGVQAGVIALLSGTIVWAWAIWRNHNFTEAANEAQAYLEEEKARRNDKELEAELMSEDWGDEDDVQAEE